MHIRLIKLLKVGLSNANYNFNENLHKKYIDTDFGNYNKIKETMVADNNKDNDEKDF